MIACNSLFFLWFLYFYTDDSKTVAQSLTFFLKFRPLYPTASSACPLGCLVDTSSSTHSKWNLHLTQLTLSACFPISFKLLRPRILESFLISPIPLYLSTSDVKCQEIFFSSIFKKIQNIFTSHLLQGYYSGLSFHHVSHGLLQGPSNWSSCFYPLPPIIHS